VGREGGEGDAYDAADGEEPDDDCDYLGQMLGVGALVTVNGHLVQVVYCDVQVEDRADTDRPEEADEQSLADLLNLVDLLVHREDDWEAPKQEDKDAEEDQTVDGDDVVVGELVPRAYSTEPDENGDVEKHVYGRLE